MAGAAIGGLTSLASAWLTQHRQHSGTRLSQDRATRQKLYKQFIDEASKLYAEALIHDEAEVSALVRAYALISRMRVLSSATVVEKAEAVIQMIVETYFAPNKTFRELRKAVEQPRSNRSAARLQRGMQRGIAGPQSSLSPSSNIPS